MDPWDLQLLVSPPTRTEEDSGAPWEFANEVWSGRLRHYHSWGVRQ